MGEITIPEALEEQYVQKVQELIEFVCGEDLELWKLSHPNLVLISNKQRLTKQEKIEGIFKRKIELMEEFLNARKQRNS